MAQGSTRGIPIDTDNTLSANSNLLVSSQQAVKTYVDGKTIVDATPTDGSSNAVSSNGVFDALALRPKLIYRGSPNFTHTGTTAETEVLKIEVPAGYLTTSDLVNLNRITVTRGLAQSGTLDIKVKISTDGNLPSGTTGQIALWQASTTQRFNGFTRGLWQESGSLNGLSNAVNFSSDITIANASLSSISFNPASKFYIHISFTLANSTDNGVLRLVDITN